MMKPALTLERARRSIRQVLKLADGDPQSESQIHEATKDLTGRNVSLQEVRDAMEWNHANGYIRSEWDKDAEIDCWFITRAGISKESIK